jgi:GNAT superfamily N-acetyltransferase
MSDAIRVRDAVEADVPGLLGLMRGLAVYEGYAAQFAVTEETLREQGFRRDPPDFHALVADGERGLSGMLVFYLVPFTFRARPTLHVKELFIAESARNRGIGEALLRAAAGEAVRRGCAAIKWQVASWNAAGRRFYERLGAVADEVWVDYGLTGVALENLARRAG